MVESCFSEIDTRSEELVRDLLEKVLVQTDLSQCAIVDEQRCRKIDQLVPVKAKNGQLCARCKRQSVKMHKIVVFEVQTLDRRCDEIEHIKRKIMKTIAAKDQALERAHAGKDVLVDRTEIVVEKVELIARDTSHENVVREGDDAVAGKVNGENASSAKVVEDRIHVFDRVELENVVIVQGDLHVGCRKECQEKCERIEI